MKPTISVIAALCVFVVSESRVFADDDKAALQGVWQAQLMLSDGAQATPEVVSAMRFTFQEDSLLVRGNFKDGREETCAYSIDASKSPKHFDFQPPNSKTPVLGIFDVKGDDLKLCLRHDESDKGRPTAFESKPETQLVLIVFKRQKE